MKRAVNLTVCCSQCIVDENLPCVMCLDSAQPLSVVRELEDVEVTAPDEACFECEVSAPVVRATEWTLKGERLQSSSCVRVEKLGAVHRLILKQTSMDMNGVIEFICGKAKSRAQLQVMSKYFKLIFIYSYILCNVDFNISKI